jgi:hypothetical protein
MSVRLVDTAVAKTYLPGEGGAVRPENETLLDKLVLGASGSIASRTNRNFIPDPPVDLTDPDNPVDAAPPTTRSFVVPRSGSIRIPDLRSYTSISFGAASLTENVDFELTQVPDERYPYVFLDILSTAQAITPFDVVNVVGAAQPTISITGRWGIWPVPDEVQNACAILAARMFAKKDGKWADLSQGGMQVAAFQFYSALPDEIQSVINSLRIRKIALV